MAIRWIYDARGQLAYYQDGQRIYSPQTGICEFFENGGWWYRMKGGAAAYFVSDDRICTPNGNATFYYGEGSSINSRPQEE
jgi:hypothetical protein